MREEPNCHDHVCDVGDQEIPALTLPILQQTNEPSWMAPVNRCIFSAWPGGTGCPGATRHRPGRGRLVLVSPGTARYGESAFRTSGLANHSPSMTPGIYSTDLAAAFTLLSGAQRRHGRRQTSASVLGCSAAVLAQFSVVSGSTKVAMLPPCIVLSNSAARCLSIEGKWPPDDSRKNQP